MKKTLVAIAALAAFGAQAQSSVTISGLVDFAGANVSGSQEISKGKTFSTTVGTSSTSVIKITAVEDLGGGMKATAMYGLDPRTLANDNIGVTNNTRAATDTVTTQTGTTVTGLARDEAFVALSGDFGTVRLGSPNSLGLEAHLAASPLGTGIGSGFSGTTGTMNSSVVNIRYNRSARFDSPAVSGFTAHVLYAPGNDQATEIPASATAGTSTALGIVNARKTTELAIKYANGPLNASLTSVKQAALETNKTGWYAGTYANAGGAADEPVATSAYVYAASYNLGDTTLYVGGNTGDALAPKASTDGSAVKASGTSFAIKQTIGKIDLMAKQTTQKYTGTALAIADPKSTVTGVRADYNFSKTAAAYVGYEEWKTGNDYLAGVAAVTGNRRIMSAGLRKSF